MNLYELRVALVWWAGVVTMGWTYPVLETSFLERTTCCWAQPQVWKSVTMVARVLIHKNEEKSSETDPDRSRHSQTNFLSLSPSPDPLSEDVTSLDVVPESNQGKEITCGRSSSGENTVRLLHIPSNRWRAPTRRDCREARDTKLHHWNTEKKQEGLHASAPPHLTRRRRRRYAPAPPPLAHHRRALRCADLIAGLEVDVTELNSLGLKWSNKLNWA